MCAMKLYDGYGEIDVLPGILVRSIFPMTSCDTGMEVGGIV